MVSAFNKQIGNRNFLSPQGFKFNLTRAPKADFFSNSANIPGINLGTAIQPTYLKDIAIPGDKLVFEDFSLRFNIDENLENYNVIQNWMRGLGYPESIYEYVEWMQSDPNNPNLDPNVSDGTLIVYNSSFQPSTIVSFQGMFPISLSSIEFDSTDTDIRYAVATVNFKYALYKISSYEPG